MNSFECHFFILIPLTIFLQNSVALLDVSFHFHIIIMSFTFFFRDSISGHIFLSLLRASLFAGIEKEIGALQLEVREELLKMFAL